MHDPLNATRRKARFIVEVRYPAAPQIFDTKGQIIEAIHPEVQDRFERWRIETGTIHFDDAKTRPTQDFTISLKRSAVTLEDFGTVQEFTDRTRKYLGLMYDQVGSKIKRVTRVGVRFIEVIAPPGGASFEDLSERIQHAYLTPAAADGLDVSDLLVKLVHKNGYLQVGPVKKGEDWLSTSFVDPDSNVPDAGVGLDIDSYDSDVEIGTRSSFSLPSWPCSGSQKRLRSV